MLSLAALPMSYQGASQDWSIAYVVTCADDIRFIRFCCCCWWLFWSVSMETVKCGVGHDKTFFCGQFRVLKNVIVHEEDQGNKFFRLSAPLYQTVFRIIYWKIWIPEVQGIEIHFCGHFMVLKDVIVCEANRGGKIHFNVPSKISFQNGLL